MIPRTSVGSRLAIALSTACLSLCGANAQSAQSQPGPNYQVQGVDDYLASHPDAARDLHNDPSLIDNPNWLAEHPQVQTYMRDHPGVAAEAARNPAAVVNRADYSALKMAHRDLTKTDSFLSHNPNLARQLENNPKLIDDPHFMAQHPGLNNYLAAHPDIRREWTHHPDEFAKAAEANRNHNVRQREQGATRK